MNRPKNVNDLQISWAIRDISSRILSFPERGLLWYFLSVIGNNDYCFDDFPALSQKTGLSERCLRNYIAKLEELKLIQVVRPERKGRGRANQYFLLYTNILETAKLSTNKATDALLPDLIRQQMPYLDPIIRQNLQDNKATDASYRDTCKKDIKTERGRKNRAHPLPVDYLHTELHEDKAQEMGMEADEFFDCKDKFMAHHKAKGTEKVDWDAEFDLWLIREERFRAEETAKRSLRAADRSSGSGSGRGQQEVRSTVPWFNGHDPLTVGNILDKGLLNGHGRKN